MEFSDFELTAFLHINIEMYKFGHMYNLKDLKRIALEKLLGAEQFHVKSDFVLVLGFLWGKTVDDNTHELRLAVYRRCALNYKIVETYPAIETKLKQLVGVVPWETFKLLQAEADTKQQEYKLTAEKQAEAKLQASKENLSQVKSNLSAHQESLRSVKKENGELRERNVRLFGDLMDIKSEWQRIGSIYCKECGQTVADTHWTEKRNANKRLLWSCKCGALAAAQR